MYPNLKLRLWTRGIRQNRLARMVDIDETTLSKIVNGFRQPTPEIRGRIAAALESDEDWLFQKVMEAPAAPLAVRHDHPSPQGRVTRRNRASVGL
jgi:transcriptional regulator with XRE-family HTH domain